MIIDAHAHIWQGSYKNDKYEIMKAVELYDISKVLVSGLGGLYPDKEEISELNFEVSAFTRENPKHIGGYCYLNPRHDNCIDELKNGIEEYGMVGVKLWVATLCDDKAVFPIVEACIDYKVPILIHAFKKAVGQLEFESLGENVAILARRYPEAKILMAHLGANCYDGIKAVRDCKNVWVDTSGTMYRRDEVDYTKKMIGAERIVFGTDMPGSGYLVNLGQIEESDLTIEEKECVFSKNILKLIDRE